MSVQPIPSQTRVRQCINTVAVRWEKAPRMYRYGRVLGVNIYGDSQIPYYMVEWENGDIDEAYGVEECNEQ